MQQRDIKSYVLHLYDDWTDTFSTEASFSYGKFDQVCAPARLEQPQIPVCTRPTGCASGSPSLYLGTD